MNRLRRLGERIGVVGGTAIIAGLAGITAWAFALSWHPARDDYRFQGVEIEARHGVVHWPGLAAAGADFGYIRATMGADGRDDRFAANWSDAYAAGVRRGAIHVWSFCRLAMDQANNFNTMVPRESDALPAAVAIDFADDCPARPERAVVLAELTRFIAMVEAHTGKPVILQVSQPVEVTYRLSRDIPRPIWEVQSFFPPAYATRPWKMWRANSMLRIDGLQGAVSWSVVAP